MSELGQTRAACVRASESPTQRHGRLLQQSFSFFNIASVGHVKNLLVPSYITFGAVDTCALVTGSCVAHMLSRVVRCGDSVCPRYLQGPGELLVGQHMVLA